MKKITLLIFLTLGIFQANAQMPCNYTYTQSGSSVTFNHSWIMPTIYSLDSIRMDFGDGNNVLHVAPVPTSTTHTYANGQYLACLTRYLTQVGSSVVIPCTSCDSIYTGCTTSISHNVSGPTVIFTTTASGAGPFTYFYDYDDGTTGSSNVHTYTSSNVYFPCVTVTDVNNNTCTACDSFYLNLTPNAVQDVSSHKLNIYPNPIIDMVMIEIPSGKTVNDLIITDMTGRRVAENYSFIKNNLLSVSLKNQARGIYFVKLQTDDNFYTSSILKQ